MSYLWKLFLVFHDNPLYCNKKCNFIPHFQLLFDRNQRYQAGFELKEPQPGDEGQLGFQLSDVYFAIEQVAAHAPQPGATIIWFRVESVIVTYNQLLKLGAKVKSSPLKMESEIVASVFDPDGNAIGLIGNQ